MNLLKINFGRYSSQFLQLKIKKNYLFTKNNWNLSWLAIKKVCKFQHFFVQFLTFSMQISTFKIECYISLPVLDGAFKTQLKIKISILLNVLKPYWSYNNQPLKSFKQIKFSCKILCKFQNHLPYLIKLCKFNFNWRLFLYFLIRDTWIR